MACIFQFTIEFLFYETTECMIINFLIPELIRKEVQSAAFSLRRTLQSICSENNMNQLQQLTLSNDILDAPSYFFIST